MMAISTIPATNPTPANLINGIRLSREPDLQRETRKGTWHQQLTAIPQNLAAKLTKINLARYARASANLGGMPKTLWVQQQVLIGGVWY